MPAVIPAFAALLERVNALVGQYESLLQAAVTRVDEELDAAISGAKVYVDGAVGNDLNPGTQEEPFATVGRAIQSTRGNTFNFIHLMANQTFPLNLGDLKETKFYFGHTGLHFRRYGTSADDSLSFPRLRIDTVVRDGENEVSQMIVHKGPLDVVLDSIEVEFSDPSNTGLPLRSTRQAWMRADSFGSGQHFSIAAGNSKFITSEHGVQLYDLSRGATARVALNKVDLSGSKALFFGGAENAVMLGGRNVTTDGVTICEGTIGANVTAPTSLGGLFS